MQPTQPDQPVSVQRRPLDLEDYISILRRHRAWIIGPAFFGLVAGVVGAFLWPDTYMASGQIRVVPPQVPQSLVASNISEEMSQKVTAIYQQIISRQNLMNLVQTYNLYPDKRKRLPIEDVVDQMRKDIAITPLRGMSTGGGNNRANFAFGVAFSYSDRRIATKVCEDLISRFMDESVKTRSSQSVMTTLFFKDEAEEAKQQLDEIDAKIAAFKAANQGTLPDDANALMMSVSSIESSIQSMNMNISRASQEKIQLEGQLRYLRDQITPPPTTTTASGSTPEPVVTPRDERLNAYDAEIARMEASVSAMRETYRESHPDVQRAMSLLATRRKERADYAAKLQAAFKQAVQNHGGAAAVLSAVNPNRETQARISQIQAAVQAKDLEIEDLNRQLDAAKARSHALQAKVEQSPLARSGYMALMRDREGAAEHYQDLSKKLQASSMATDLEKRSQGETLEVLEQPVIPLTPSAPKREIIIAIAAIAGLVFGIGLAFARELKDMSLKSLKDVRAYTKLTVLGSIPLLENDFVVRRRRRMAWLGWSAAFLIGILLMSGSVIYYYTSKT